MRWYLDIPMPQAIDDAWAVIILEHLRYAGILAVNGFGYTGCAQEGHIRIYQPTSINGQPWARSNKNRMKSFGITATVGCVKNPYYY